MKAKYNQNSKTEFSTKHRKDQLYSAYKVLDSNFNVLIDLRVYYPNSVAYACVWINDGKKFYTQGSGTASGCGYHVVSAAVDDAILNSGFELFGSPYIQSENENLKRSCSISGVGDTAIEMALLAIGKSLTRKKLHLVGCFA